MPVSSPHTLIQCHLCSFVELHVLVARDLLETMVPPSTAVLLLAVAALQGSAAVANQLHGLVCVAAINSGFLNTSVAQVSEGSTCTGHNATDGSYVCGGEGSLVEGVPSVVFMGTEDFVVTVELMMATVAGTAAAITFHSAGGANFLGLDSGGHGGKAGHFFVQGVDWGGGAKIEPTPCPPAGTWFTLGLARSKGLLTVDVNGTPKFTVPMAFSVENTILRPFRSTFHTRAFTLCAPQLPAPGAPPPPPPPPVVVFKGGDAGIPGYRIPALCAAGGVLVAFAEGRAGGDFGIKRNMYARSVDGGETFSTPVVVPGTWEPGWIVGQPTCAYDPVRKLLVLQYQNSTHRGEVNGATYQITSGDAGATWGKPTPMNPFLGKFAGLFPGPGNGVVLSSRSAKPGRYVFSGWNAIPGDPYHFDVVYYSDDGGKTYQPSETQFPANYNTSAAGTFSFEEPTLAETQSGDLLVNMRMDADGGKCGSDGCGGGRRRLVVVVAGVVVVETAGVVVLVVVTVVAAVVAVVAVVAVDVLVDVL